MTLFYPNISQVYYFGVGDVDECSIIAAFWAARQAGFTGKLPTIREFRRAAGVPDRPGPTGLTTNQLWQGVSRTGLAVGASILSRGTTWATFARKMQAGGAASVALSSADLPVGYRYGFQGAHSVGLTWDKGQWYIANPLAPEGSGPQAISEADIKRAVLAFGPNGSVQGVMFTVTGSSLAPVQTASVVKEDFNALKKRLASVTGSSWAVDARNVVSFYQAKHPMKDAGRRG